MTVGGDLNCFGNKNVSEHTFPFLKSVGGRLIIANSGFTKLPDTLEEVGGDVIISRKDTKSLLDDILKAKEKGIVKGEIYFCD
jgi:hypothetical protein